MQSIYPEKILRLRFQERKRNFQDSGSEELCVVFPGVIARFDGSDIQVSSNDSDLRVVDLGSIMFNPE